jgi:hypothetical protein
MDEKKDEAKKPVIETPHGTPSAATIPDGHLRKEPVKETTPLVSK